MMSLSTSVLSLKFAYKIELAIGHLHRANGAKDASPGQRPGFRAFKYSVRPEGAEAIRTPPIVLSHSLCSVDNDRMELLCAPSGRFSQPGF